jgi:hypothetical protein
VGYETARSADQGAVTSRDHNDLAERVREVLRERPHLMTEQAVVAALAELVYELRARVEVLESEARR